MSVKLVYFAWVKERIGLSDEIVDLPETVKTGEELIDWLATRGDNYAHALEDRLAIKIAVDQEHLPPQDPFGDATEIALFPPMTGG